MSEMSGLFLMVLNMSVTAGVAALIIIIVRASVGKGLPRTFSYALWAIVLYRMISPVSFASIFSIVAKIKPGVDTYTDTLKAISWQDALDFEVLSGHRAQELGIVSYSPPQASIETAGELATVQLPGTPMSGDSFTIAVTALWILGIFALLLYNAISYRRLCMSLNTATFIGDCKSVEECKTALRMNRRVDVYESDKTESPFVYGILRPKVILPASAIHASTGESGERLRHILLHELYHIKRFDYLVKPLAFLALCVHWFNPLLWIAFRLFDKDMEMSCDEGAVKALKTGTGEDYAATLLNMASRGNGIGKSCALAFRETNVGTRVKHIVKYKKPGLTVGIISVILLALCAVSLLSNPVSSAGVLKDGQTNILIMCSAEGSDFPDTFLLLGYNDDRKEADIAFLPRDLDVLPGDETVGIAERKLSGYAGKNPPEAVMERLNEMLDIEIHNFVKTDTGVFRDLVDAMGGVEFDVPVRMVYEDPYQNLFINLEQGRQVLDGEKAEMLVRYRTGYPEGDLKRIEVQKAFLATMIEQKAKVDSAKALYGLLSGRSETDLNIGKANKLGTLFLSAETVTFVDLPIIQASGDPFMPLRLTSEAKDTLKEKF